MIRVSPLEREALKIGVGVVEVEVGECLVGIFLGLMFYI